MKLSAISMWESTKYISKGENTIYLTSKEEPMKLSEISMQEST